MTLRPPNPELAGLPNLFLFNQRNRAFVDGWPQSIHTGQRGYYVAAVVLILTSIAVFIHSFNEIREWDSLIQQGGTTILGTIVARDSATSCNDGCSTSYTITYRFYPIGSMTGHSRGSFSVDRNTYNRLNTGDPIEITYFTANPDISWVTGHNQRPRDPRAYDVLGVVLTFGVTSLFIIAAVRLTQRTRCLMREGRLLRGDVTALEMSEETEGDDVEGSPVKSLSTTLYCRFRTPNGRSIQTKRVVRGGIYWARDAPLAVLYVNDHLYQLL